MLDVHLLGQFEIKRDGEPIKLSSHAAQLLLAYLILHAGSRQKREKLAGVLWPEEEEPIARRRLRQTLWRLRKAIGGEYLLVDKASIGFDASSDYCLDVEELRNEIKWDEASDDLIPNLPKYAGELLPGFYSEWVTREREQLQSLFEARMQILLGRLLNDRRWMEVVECGEQWIALGGISEPAYRAVMIAHSALGDLPHVSEVYSRCLEALRDELGIDPSEETRSLFEDLIKGEGPPGIPRRKPRSNISPQPTAFIGREKELGQVRGLLGTPACRVVTLTGPGGIGKTRLAIEVALEAMADFVDGAFIIAPAIDARGDVLVSKIAAALGYSFTPDTEPKAQLMDYLRSKEMLLIMDDFEHMLDGVELISAILEHAPQVKLLITSRERMHIYGEWTFEVEGLAYPDQLDVTSTEKHSAIELFLESARRAQTSFTPSQADLQAVIRICHLLEGVPLAIELAAPWVRALSCTEIADEIEANLDFLASATRTGPERHSSLRASMEYSWNLLSAEEKSVFRRLAVFRGGFRREAAESVADASLPMLSRLVDHSLIRRGSSDRYVSHRMLMQYAHEKLSEHPNEFEAACERHGKWYAGYVQSRKAHLRGSKQDAALEEVGIEIENIRSACQWAVEERRVDELSELVGVLRVFYDVHGWYREAEALYASVIECLTAGSDKPERMTREWAWLLANALACQGWFCHRQSFDGKATVLLQRSLSIAREFRNQEIEGDALDSLGIIAMHRREHEQAKQLFEESLAIWKRIGDPWWEAAELNCLSHIARRQGEVDEAKRLATQSLSKFMQAGNQWGIAAAYAAVGTNALNLGEYEEARKCFQDSLAMCQDIEYQLGIAKAHYGLGRVAFQMESHDEASEHLQTSLKIYSDLGRRIEAPAVLELLGEIFAVRGDSKAARECAHDALEIIRKADRTPAALGQAASIAGLLSAVEETHHAILLLGHILAQDFIEQADYSEAENALSSMSAHLPQEMITNLLERGEAMEMEEILAEIVQGRTAQ